VKGLVCGQAIGPGKEMRLYRTLACTVKSRLGSHRPPAPKGEKKKKKKKKKKKEVCCLPELDCLATYIGYVSRVSIQWAQLLRRGEATPYPHPHKARRRGPSRV
jgi:hypothetical protein